ncbi:TPA: prohibitin family protein [Candidatus Saccharibacteria bacterium]|nr:prohibitin family protein [Candidatus Saccharibacteria bacterium]HIO87887.1 prohibitin family protein [Candidatus Saccharibacteria bacterium]
MVRRVTKPNLAQFKMVQKIGIAGVLIAGFILILLTSVRVVGTGEVGVVTRFGKVTGRELGEGIHLVLPFGIEQASIYDIKIQKQTEDAASASKDLQDVSTTLTLNYRLQADKIKEIHQTIGVNYQDKLIEPALQEVFKAASAKFSAQELITQRAQVKAETFELLKDRLDVFGIVVDDISIVDFTFSPAFTQAIEDKQIAEQNAQRAKFNLEAARTDAEAQQAQAQTLSPLFLQKQAIEKWNGQLPTYLGNGTVFNIPLGN